MLSFSKKDKQNLTSVLLFSVFLKEETKKTEKRKMTSFHRFMYEKSQKQKNEN